MKCKKSGRRSLNKLSCPKLSFLNISNFELIDSDLETLNLQNLTELICHTNGLTLTKPFENLPSLKLLDLENNSVSFVNEAFMQKLRILNLKGNPLLIDQNQSVSVI